MVRFYYTGSQSYYTPNSLPFRSTGGWVSCTPVRASSIYGLFDSLLTREERIKRGRYRLIAIKNENAFPIRDVRLYVSMKFSMEDRLQEQEARDKRTAAEKVSDYFSIRAVGVDPQEIALQPAERIQSAGTKIGFAFPTLDNEFTNLHGEHYDIPDFNARTFKQEDGTVVNAALPEVLVDRLDPGECYGVSLEMQVNTKFINRKRTEEELEEIFADAPEHPWDANLCEMSFKVVYFRAADLPPPLSSSPNI